MARLQDFYDNVKSMQADFTQTLFDNTGEVMQRAGGTLVIQRPGKFRWDYKDPYEQLIVADGRKLWLYDIDLEQITVKSMDIALGNTPAMLLSGTQPLKDDFDIIPMPQREGLQWVELIPKGETDGFEQVRLGFGKRELEMLEMIDGLGQVTRITFNNIKRNVSLDKQLFIFKPPVDVDVVGDLD
jgi:outer membrane lipoprotein carrier protein